MEMFQRLRMVIDFLHVTKVWEQSLVTNHSTVLTLTVLKYHLHTQKCSELQNMRGVTWTGCLMPLTASLTLSLTSSEERYSMDLLLSASKGNVGQAHK